jgi:hypothetical protein
VIQYFISTIIYQYKNTKIQKYKNTKIQKFKNKNNSIVRDKYFIEIIIIQYCYNKWEMNQPPLLIISSSVPIDRKNG